MIKEVFPGIPFFLGIDPDPPTVCVCACFCTENDPKKDDTTEDKDREA
jgi:hypothetical protein